MIFRHPRAVEQLVRFGVVATMRTYRYRPGQGVLIRIPGRVLRGRVAGVMPNTPENRLKYYMLSGFDSPDLWLAEALKLHSRIPDWIVIVEVLL